MEEEKIDFCLHPSLNDVESKKVKCINKMCYKHGFEKGVPYCLAAREDFNFEEAVWLFPSGCIERLALSKSEGASYLDALLPHETYRLRQAKEKEIERKHVLRMSTECEAGNRLRCKRGESSGAISG